MKACISFLPFCSLEGAEGVELMIIGQAMIPRCLRWMIVFIRRKVEKKLREQKNTVLNAKIDKERKP